jgi:hypothetical protein
MTRAHGRRVLGAIAGFILGGSVGVLLLTLGVVPLDSIVLVIVPFVGLVVGLAWAWWAPLGQPSRPIPSVQPEVETVQPEVGPQ